jgi:hypothetical protein
MTKPVEWRKSSRSGTQQSACVEVADLAAGVVGVRDSKDPGGPHLSVSAAAFGQLVHRLKDNTR